VWASPGAGIAKARIGTGCPFSVQRKNLRLRAILQSRHETKLMGKSANAGAPFTQARDNLSELPDQAEGGAEQMITKNSAPPGAPFDADRRDDYPRLEREGIHLQVIEDARHGLADITAARTFEAEGAITQLQRRRQAAAKISNPAESSKKHD